MSRFGIRRRPSRSAACSRALAAENPLRERPQALLMLALYRCGRHAEALEVYRHAHHLLAEEQGLEPGLALRRLELEILRQEPSLSLLDHGYEWREAVATC